MIVFHGLIPGNGKGREIWGLYSRESRETEIPAHPFHDLARFGIELCVHHAHFISESKLMAAPFHVNLCEDDTLMLSFDKTENQDWCLDLLKTSLLKTTLTGIMSSKFQTALKEKLIWNNYQAQPVLLLESPCSLVGWSVHHVSYPIKDMWPKLWWPTRLPTWRWTR